ncbi:MAG: uracil-DNA glycosylase [Bacteroidales bacterium]|nr:uracil-DNA glycosylase [Bacteroidales bacterium]MDD2280702.1 uracil-DNA glycosylase [Bacteroidales bacterium]MDD4490932.1 uracil-DNA glycosylase [Bacteroidales bacterium]HNW48154.1 uracil-DNA glycosylase [Bacteroidales bacterium]HPS95648.1 uracil-DNA glycosylase [Bacteroidales bacterium]
MNVQIESSWKELLSDEFEKPYFVSLSEYLKREKLSGIKIYPKGPDIFNAFNMTPVQNVKVVILGQDPYHGPGQAHGLSFSVPEGVALPPSLQNIYKELFTDLGIKPANSGSLVKWAQQGVFLLNAVLTVRAGEAASHSKIGWMEFTDAVISKLSKERDGIVFMLWGNFAKGKRDLIDTSRHFILEAPHPSPLARGGFFGCRHFSKANEFIKSKGKEPVNWALE